MIKFGPSGFSEDFAKEYNSTEKIPQWLKMHGLNCYELSFTNGIRLSDETAKKYGEIFFENNIEISVHAPYYINFANPDPEMIEKSDMYIIASLQKMQHLKAKKLVFHPGTKLKLSREEAFENVYNNIKQLILRLDERGMSDFILCPETMGKHGQIGTVEEIAKICTLDERIIPTIDFGHVNAFGLGLLKTEADFESIFETLKKYLGERFNKIHIHFSKIQFGEKGEIRHLTFADTEYGPDFEILAKVLKKYDVEACVICESAGTQTQDAVIMKNILTSL